MKRILVLLVFIVVCSVSYSRDFLLVSDNGSFYYSNPSGKAFFQSQYENYAFRFEWFWDDDTNRMCLGMSNSTIDLAVYVPKLGNNSLLVIDISKSVYEPVIKEYSLQNSKEINMSKY